mmetsp:Transcript_4097/g.12471  ORF Transcript_4097/g.12471 Transcript_4097/m.12471 type:complete len:304 (+) Transcript_4097:670-1581(+)
MKQIQRGAEDEFVINDRCPHQHGAHDLLKVASLRALHQRDLRLCVHDLVYGAVAQADHIPAGALQQLCKVVRHRLHLVDGEVAHHKRIRVNDRTRVQSKAAGRGKVGRHRDATSTLTEERDTLRIAAQRDRVLLHPAQRHLLIQETVVASQWARGQESQRTQAVLYGHYNHSGAVDHKVAPIQSVRSRAHIKPASVQVQHDGGTKPTLDQAVVRCGRVDTQVETVFCLIGTQCERRLWTHWHGVGGCFEHVRITQWDRCLPAQLSHWSSGIGNAEERSNIVGDGADKQTRSGVDRDHIWGRRG